jgi:hypothetical protein
MWNNWIDEKKKSLGCLSKRNFSPKSQKKKKQPDSSYRLRQAALHILYIILYFFIFFFSFHLYQLERERYCVTLYTLAGSLIQFISLFSLSFFSDVSVTRLVDRNHERTQSFRCRADVIKTEPPCATDKHNSSTYVKNCTIFL